MEFSLCIYLANTYLSTVSGGGNELLLYESGGVELRRQRLEWLSFGHAIRTLACIPQQQGGRLGNMTIILTLLLHIVYIELEIVTTRSTTHLQEGRRGEPVVVALVRVHRAQRRAAHHRAYTGTPTMEMLHILQSTIVRPKLPTKCHSS